MHDDDLSPVERAEQIVDAAAKEHTKRAAAGISAMCEMSEKFRNDIAEMIPKLVEALQPLVAMAQEIERYEDECVAALEDDFYSGRAPGVSP